MAITDFITTTLNLPEDRIDSISSHKHDGVLHIKVKLKPDYPECPFCSCHKPKIKEYKVHSYKHLDIAGVPSIIDWSRRRYICPDCRKTYSEANPFGLDTYNISYAVQDTLAKALHSVNSTYDDIAHRFHVSNTLVQIYADSYIHAPRFQLPVNMGIDEIHSSMAKYGGSYLCVFVDNEKRCLQEILPDRSKRCLARYFEAIPEVERNTVRYITIDMWEPYKDICEKYLKNATIAVDPFHVVEHLTAGFTRLRVDLMNHCDYNSPEYYLLKHWHKLLETDYNLDNEPRYNSYFKMKLNYRQLYDMLLNINPTLRTAYLLKENYRDFNSTCIYDESYETLDALIQKFESADLYCYEQFVMLLKHWRNEICNSFMKPDNVHRQSNALAESINQKIRTLLANSYGLANFERFRARALYCLNDRMFYALTSKLTHNKRTGKNRGPYNKIVKAITNEPDFFADDGPDNPEDE